MEPTEFIAKFVNKNKLDMKLLQIKNYKNLKDFKIDSLARVNLIVGKNNVGKSTLLEAVAIVCEGYRIPECVFRDRELTLMSDKFGDLMSHQWLFPHFNDEVSDTNTVQISCIDEKNTDFTISFHFVYYTQIEIRNDDGQMQIQYKMIEGSEQPTDGEAYMKGLAIKVNDKNESLYRFQSKEEIQSNSLIITQDGYRSSAPSITKIIDGKRTISSSILIKRIEKRYEYIPPYELMRIDNPGRFDRVSKEGDEDIVVSALQIMYPEIEQLVYIGSPMRIPYVKLREKQEKQPLRSMGDGINRVLTIVLSMLQLKNGGVLLIEEFENGLHYAVQTQLWKMVYQLADKLNVQVFATTHSDDCIKSFVEADSNQMGKLIRLENRDGDIVSVAYDEKDELDYISTSNLEIR